eukprot:364437-Chlamydomonas_euryale.AAC.2
MPCGALPCPAASCRAVAVTVAGVEGRRGHGRGETGDALTHKGSGSVQVRGPKQATRAKPRQACIVDIARPAALHRSRWRPRPNLHTDTIQSHALHAPSACPRTHARAHLEGHRQHDVEAPHKHVAKELEHGGRVQRRASPDHRKRDGHAPHAVPVVAVHAANAARQPCVLAHSGAGRAPQRRGNGGRQRRREACEQHGLGRRCFEHLEADRDAASDVHHLGGGKREGGVAKTRGTTTCTERGESCEDATCTTWEGGLGEREGSRKDRGSEATCTERGEGCEDDDVHHL